MIRTLFGLSFLAVGVLFADEQGRLAQARLRFSEHQYSETLVLLAPFLKTQQPEVMAMAGHSAFELGDYLTAASYFQNLSDATSLYRMVQIQDKLNNFAELEKYYSQIATPPDFVRYIYARQLLLNGRLTQAIAEFDQLMRSEYQEQAVYLKAVALIRQEQYAKAQDLLASLFKSQHLTLAQLAKLTSARAYDQQDQPEQAISIYETLNYPEELARAQMLAGDMSPDLKKAQDYYQKAEKNTTDRVLLVEILVRQDKNDEARGVAQVNQNEVQSLRKEIIENRPPEIFPEVVGLNKLQRRIDALSPLLSEVDRIALQEEYRLMRSEILAASKPVWLAELDEKVHAGDQAAIQIGQAERFRLRKRIGQIEQTKAAELKLGEDLLKPTVSNSSWELQKEYDGIVEEIRLLKKDLREQSLESIAAYYDSALTPLKSQEKFENENAIAQLETFLNDHPESAQNSTILLSLADLYFDLDPNKSIGFADRFLMAQPNSEHADAADYLRAMSYLYEGETGRAQRIFQHFVTVYPHSMYLDEVRFRLGEIEFDAKRYASAEPYFEQILRSPEGAFYAKALYKSAWIKYLQNHYSEAKNQFRQLLDMDSGGSDILRQEASRYLAISILESSKTPIQTAKEEHCGRSVWVHLGNLLAKADRNSEAATAFQEAITLDPKDPKNYELDLRILDLTPSFAVKKSLIARYLEDPAARDLVQRVLLDLSIETHAEAKQAKSPELFKESAEDYALFIRHFPEDEHLDQVIFYYAESSFDADLYHYAAIGFEQVRDWPWETEYRQRAAVNTVYAYARAKENQKYVAAVDWLAQKYPMSPELPTFLFDVATLYEAQGNHEQAHQRFEQLIASYPGHQAAKVAAQTKINEALASEQWLEAADTAKRYAQISPEFEPIEKNARFKYANQLYANAQAPEQYGQVANLYLALLKEDPRSDIGDKILFNAGMALERSQRYEEAENLFERLSLEYPKSPLAQSALEQRAAYFEQRLHFEKAGLLYAKIQNNQTALLRAALDFEAAQKYETAAALFEKFIREYPQAAETPDAYQRAAKAYHAAQRFTQEQRVWQEFGKRYKNKIAVADYDALKPGLQTYQALKINAQSSKQQAKQLTQKTEKLAALQKSYEQIIKNYELSPWTLASIYQIGHLYEDLFQALIKAPCPKDVAQLDTEACDEYASLLEDKAVVLEKKAIDAYQLAVDKSHKIVGGSEWVLNSKAALYRMKPSDYEPAEALIEETVVGYGQEPLPEESMLMARIATNPLDLDTRLQMARVFYHKNQLEAAQLTLEDSLEKDSNSATANLWLGHVYRAQGQKAEAISAYEKSGLPEARDNVGLLYLEQGDLERAYSNLQKASDAWPQSAAVQQHLANYYFMAKDYPKASMHYEAALKLDPKLSSVKLNMGLLALAQQRYDAAQTSFVSFLEEAKPEPALQSRVEGYLKLVNQKIQLGKQRHENNT